MALETSKPKKIAALVFKIIKIKNNTVSFNFIHKEKFLPPSPLPAKCPPIPVDNFFKAQKCPYLD